MFASRPKNGSAGIKIGFHPSQRLYAPSRPDRPRMHLCIIDDKRCMLTGIVETHVQPVHRLIYFAEVPLIDIGIRDEQGQIRRLTF
jgi:hypothetical protein